jgi:hypothetical protein
MHSAFCPRKALCIGRATSIIAVLSPCGDNTTTILARLGVGGIAIALAAQKTIENLFGGVSIITDRAGIGGRSLQDSATKREPWRTSVCGSPGFARRIARW